MGAARLRSADAAAYGVTVRMASALIRGTMPKIVVSYRRADTGPIAGRIFDRLGSQYGFESVFMDVDNIPFGVDFREHIQQELSLCDVLVVIIGPRWMGTAEAGKTRLDDETDPVRIEVETAMRV